MKQSELISASLILFILFSFNSYSQEVLKDVEKKVQEMGLDTLRMNNVLVYFDHSDSLRAQDFAEISVSMSAYFKKKFDIDGNIKVTALQPDNWFSEYPGIPYAIPWRYDKDNIIMMPSSLTEGIVVDSNRTREQNKMYIDRILVHEYSHFIEKEFYRKHDKNDHPKITWFNEFVVNYFMSAYIYDTDQKWAEELEKHDWTILRGFKPKKYTLDWSFMNELTPEELGITYGWYQILLDEKTAELYKEYGIEFLFRLKNKIDWNNSDNWTTAYLLQSMEEISPGITEWSQHIEEYVSKKSK